MFFFFFLFNLFLDGNTPDRTKGKRSLILDRLRSPVISLYKVAFPFVVTKVNLLFNCSPVDYQEVSVFSFPFVKFSVTLHFPTFASRSLARTRLAFSRPFFLSLIEEDTIYGGQLARREFLSFSQLSFSSALRQTACMRNVKFTFASKQKENVVFFVVLRKLFVKIYSMSRCYR